MVRSGDGSEGSPFYTGTGALARARPLSSFGRGWISLERDIGLPDEALLDTTWPDDEAPAPQGARRSLLPLAEGAGGGPVAGETVRQGPAPAADPRWPEPAATPVHPQAFTSAKRARFLLALAEHGNARLAAREAGTSPQSAYVARRRDAAFAAGWDAAMLHAADHAGQVLAERALHGVSEPVWYRGEVVGSRTRYDNRLLLAHLARLDAHEARLPSARRAQVRAIARDFDVYVGELATGTAVPEEAMPTLAQEVAAATSDACDEFPEDLADVDPAFLERVMVDAEFDRDEDEEIDPEEVYEQALDLWCEDAAQAAEDDWRAYRDAMFARADALLYGLPFDPRADGEGEEDACGEDDEAGRADEAAPDGEASPAENAWPAGDANGREVAFPPIEFKSLDAGPPDFGVPGFDVPDFGLTAAARRFRSGPCQPRQPRRTRAHLIQPQPVQLRPLRLAPLPPGTARAG